MDTPHTDPEGIKPRPDYPPKTPPPPKRPPNPPPPDPPRSEAEKLLHGLPVPQRGHRPGLPVMKNRRGASWTLETGPWIPKKAARHVAGRLTDWGLRAPDMLEEVVTTLTTAVIADGGRRISIHLSEQDGRVIVLALSHQDSHASAGDVLPALRDLGTASCGTETTSEGRQVWALLDLLPAAA